MKERDSEVLVEAHKEIAKELNKMYEKKNKDYGNSFEKGLDTFGIIPAVARITEKNDRLVELVTSGEQHVKDESIEDSLLDMANYAIMTVMWLRKNEGGK